MHDENDNNHSCLQLTKLANLVGNQHNVKAFSDWRTALDHLCNHVLTNPECEGWAIINPRLLDIVDLANHDARYQFAKKACDTEGMSAQELFNEYAQAVNKAISDSKKLGWFVCFGNNNHVLIGISGLLAVIEDNVLRTAFLPGQGNASAVVENRIESKNWHSPLPRERRVRHTSDDEKRKKNHREIEKLKKRISQWNNNEKAYYLVFRPSIGNIWSANTSTFDFNGTIRSSRHYFLLKSVLPRRKQLSLEHWQSLRDQCENRQ